LGYKFPRMAKNTHSYPCMHSDLLLFVSTHVDLKQTRVWYALDNDFDNQDSEVEPNMNMPEGYT
jgi:hypothetical protein